MSLRGCGGMVDAQDLKSWEGNFVWVQVPPPAPKRPLGLFFVDRTLVLCTTNALHLEPTLCGWRPSLLAHLRSQVLTWLQVPPPAPKDLWVFFLLIKRCLKCFIQFCWNNFQVLSKRVWLNLMSPCLSFLRHKHRVDKFQNLCQGLWCFLFSNRF